MDKRLYVLVLFGIFMMTVFGVTGCKKIYQTTEIVKELKEYKIDSEEDMTEVAIVMVNDGGNGKDVRKRWKYQSEKIRTLGFPTCELDTKKEKKKVYKILTSDKKKESNSKEKTEVTFNGKTLDDWSTILYVKNKEGKGISMYLDITHCCIYFKEKKYFLEKKDAEYLYSLYWQIIPGPDYL